MAGHELRQELSTRIRQVSAAMVPPGQYATAHSRYLGWIGPGPFDTAWLSFDGVEGIGDGTGTPPADGIEIGDLPAASTPLDGTELVVVVQGGVTSQATAQDIADLGGGGGGLTLPFVADDGTTTRKFGKSAGLFTVENILDSGGTAALYNVASGSTFEAALLAQDDSGHGAVHMAAVLAGLSQVATVLDGGTVFQQTANNATFLVDDYIALNFESSAGGNAGIGVTFGDPNGIVSALLGSLLLDNTPDRPWYNTDGGTTWTQL